MSYRVKLSDAADLHISSQYVYYELAEHLKFLSKNPYAQERYDQVRCMPIKGFPFMFHFGIDEEKKLVKVHTLIHTSVNPKTNWGKDDWVVSEPAYYYGIAAL